MDVKGSALRLYIQKFVISKSQNMEVPGFLSFNLSGKTPIYARQILMPEDFFINLEINLAKKGENAQRLLYSAGKKFGYRFSLLGGFSNYSDKKGSELVNYINIINKFIEGTYAEKIEFETNPNTKVSKYLMENPVVVNKLGYGYFMPLGAAAGLMAYIFQDKSIEGVLENFDIRSKKGTLLYAPADYLKTQNKKFFKENDLSDIKPSVDYVDFNRVAQLNYSNYSLKTLLDSKFFTFNNGVITNNDNRYFILEVSAMYILEKELNVYAEEIYDAAFKAGYDTLKDIKKLSVKIIMDYLSAFGWGDVVIIKESSKYTINIAHFPYTRLYNEINYSIFSGILSGMLYAVTKERINFNKVQKSITDNNLSISLFS